MKLTEQHVKKDFTEKPLNDGRIQWLIDGLDLGAFHLKKHTTKYFLAAIKELKQRRDEDRQQEFGNGKA